MRRLRAHGFAQSDVAREAIDARFEALAQERPTVDAAAIGRFGSMRAVRV